MVQYVPKTILSPAMLLMRSWLFCFSLNAADMLAAESCRCKCWADKVERFKVGFPCVETWLPVVAGVNGTGVFPHGKARVCTAWVVREHVDHLHASGGRSRLVLGSSEQEITASALLGHVWLPNNVAFESKPHSLYSVKMFKV